MNTLSRYACGCITAPTTIHNWWRSSNGANEMNPLVFDFSYDCTDDVSMDAAYPDEGALADLSTAFQDTLNLGCDNNDMQIAIKSLGVDVPNVPIIPFTTSSCIKLLGDAVPLPNAQINIFRSSDMALVARAVVIKSEVLQVAHRFIHSIAFSNSSEFTACWSGEDNLDLGLTVMLRNEDREWVGTAIVIDAGLPALPILVDAPLHTLSPSIISTINPANIFLAFLAYHLQRREAQLCREGNFETYQPPLVKYEDPTVVHGGVPIEVNTVETDSRIVHGLEPDGKEQDRNRPQIPNMIEARSPFTVVGGIAITSAVFAPPSPRIRLALTCHSPATPTPKQRSIARKTGRMRVTGVGGVLARKKGSDAQFSRKRKYEDNEEKDKMKGAEANRATKKYRRLGDLRFRLVKDWLPALTSPFREPAPSAPVNSSSKLLAQASPSATLRSRRKRNPMDDDEEKALATKRARRTAEGAMDALVSLAYGSPPPAPAPALRTNKRKGDEESNLSEDKEDRSKKRPRIPTNSGAHRLVGVNLINGYTENYEKGSITRTDVRVKLGSHLKLLENRQPFKDILNNVKEKPPLVLGSGHLVSRSVSVGKSG